MEVSTQLDDKAFVVRNDPKEMYRLTVEFPDQCAKAVSIAQSTALKDLPRKPSLVCLSGLGGSAAGGDFVRAMFEESGSVPYFVNRDYVMPNYIGADTLVVACSYSGNTEETLAAYAEAKAKGAMIVAVTSGGKLAAQAAADGFDVIQIPGGQPPRTALGFLLMPVVVLLSRYGLLPAQDMDALVAHLRKGVSEWGVEVGFDQNPTKQLAAKLQGKVSVIYGLGSWPALVGNRWKGQINENAKNMTFANVFPELNHNEILGWVQADAQGVDQWIGILLQDGTESAKLKKRFEVTARLIAGVCSFETVTATGNTLLEKMVSLALYGDFVSLYLAALNDVDPENIDSINILKDELSRVP